MLSLWQVNTGFGKLEFSEAISIRSQQITNLRYGMDIQSISNCYGQIDLSGFPVTAPSHIAKLTAN